jgi:PAS domain S-box-containing protein
VAESRVSSILLVDDDPADLLALEAALAPLGQHLVKASSGKEALEHLLHEEFSVLLLDVEMPGLDGFETVRLLQQHAPHALPPLLFLSARSGEADSVRQGYALGAVDYLPKPVDADILRTKVSVFIRLSHTARRAKEQLGFQSTILENVQDSIIVTDFSGHIVHWNKGAEALFGYSAQEMLGQTPHVLYPEQDPAVLAQDMARILEGEDYVGEWRARRKDGALIWVDIKTRLMRDASGRGVGFIGVSKDITARRNAEAALRESELQYRLAFLSAEKERRTAEILSRLGLAFASELDRDKLVQRVTDEATELTGAAFGAFFHSRLNEKGESYFLYTLSGVPRDAFERFPMPRKTRIFGPTFDGLATVRMDDVTQSPDYGQNPPYRGMPEGHLPVRSYLAVPVRSRSGAVLGGLFFGHPEPGRFKKEHERLVEGLAAQAAVALDNSVLYQQAQRAVSLRDEFLQVAAHELRTPITSLKLKIQSLLRAASAVGPSLSAEKLHGKLEEVERIMGKLNVLIEELLDISRITAGNLRLTFEEVDLVSVVREVALRFEAQAAQLQVPIHIQAPAPLVGRWDRLRLEQVLTNLLSNALKYGAGNPVYIDVSSDGTHARLTVRDEGIGIAPESLSRIFGRFERAVSERHYGGMGLGLYITRQIVEALGGTVHVESTPGQGSTFRIELPLAPPQPEAFS